MNNSYSEAGFFLSGITSAISFLALIYAAYNQLGVGIFVLALIVFISGVAGTIASLDAHRKNLW